MRRPRRPDVQALALCLLVVLSLVVLVEGAPEQTAIVRSVSALSLALAAFVLGLVVMRRYLVEARETMLRATETHRVVRYGVYVGEGDDGSTVAIVTRDGMPVHTIRLPEGYDPDEDQGEAVIEALREWRASEEGE